MAWVEYNENDPMTKELGKRGFFVTHPNNPRLGQWLDAHGNDLDPTVRKNELQEKIDALNAQMELLNQNVSVPLELPVATPDMIDKPVVWTGYEVPDAPLEEKIGPGRPKGS